jgi:hypothetical protein
MNTNTGSDQGLRALPGPGAASAAIQGMAWPAVPPGRGSPGGGYRDRSAPPTAGHVTSVHTGAAPTRNRRRA